VTYTRKNKYEGRYLVKKGSSKYTRQQQGHTDVERRIMDKENNSQNNYVVKEYGKRHKFIRRNIKKQY